MVFIAKVVARISGVGSVIPHDEDVAFRDGDGSEIRTTAGLGPSGRIDRILMRGEGVGRVDDMPINGDAFISIEALDGLSSRGYDALNKVVFIGCNESDVGSDVL